MTDQVLFEVFGNLGRITLNRPKALNALTTEMCTAMIKVLQAWENDDRIGAVLVEGAGDRAFCAGGDIIMLHDSGKAKDGRAEDFWRTEYALNELIHRYKKPYIALMDGIVMGGGVGLSVHGRIRIAGDTTLFAMPETGIGFFPDVGGTYFLPRLGTAIGQWLGLTGARLKTAQACALGVATTYIPSEAHEAFAVALGRAELDGSDAAVMDVIKAFVKTPPQAETLPDALQAFEQPNPMDILKALEVDAGEWATKQASLLKSKSPLAVHITFEALKRGAEMNFREAMTQELGLSLAFLTTQDFFEGVRAAVIDKDRNPKWSSGGLALVNVFEMERHFVPPSSPLQFLD
ncbi:MAG: enoyl-CoA hydratase [Robiginitomaculum sp.]|nr:MAG: enoyl-CoA hydratase [Robiginitomaculum sp.]